MLDITTFIGWTIFLVTLGVIIIFSALSFATVLVFTTIARTRYRSTTTKKHYLSNHLSNKVLVCSYSSIETSAGTVTARSGLRVFPCRALRYSESFPSPRSPCSKSSAFEDRHHLPATYERPPHKQPPPYS